MYPTASIPSSHEVALSDDAAVMRAGRPLVQAALKQSVQVALTQSGSGSSQMRIPHSYVEASHSIARCAEGVYEDGTDASLAVTVLPLMSPALSSARTKLRSFSRPAQSLAAHRSCGSLSLEWRPFPGNTLDNV